MRWWKGLDLQFAAPRHFWFQLESGLHYNWHRHYDPTTGRYVQPDPLGMPDGPARWTYVTNSPLMWTDREGEIAFIPIIIGIGAGYAFDYFLEKYKKNHCACEGTPLGWLGNSANGGVIGCTGKFAYKPRGGIAGGGHAGKKTSAFSQMNHALYRGGWYPLPVRRGLTKILRKAPYIGSGLAAYQMYEAYTCE